MSYSKNKSQITRVPFELNMANGVNDNFTVQIGSRAATRFRASDEITKYIDDDYSKCLNASGVNANAAAACNGRDASTHTEPPRPEPSQKKNIQEHQKLEHKENLILLYNLRI